ncbi:hypothetical protein UY3_08857 [Chelonia mydas]|uniref:Uncharacterized protein n=1 Tax=Chelonia mydas TaxID=8469 RepID=M7B7R1_CHEMY|nr:hypothetical protein UY3_08857 [Chelonia mydas]
MSKDCSDTGYKLNQPQGEVTPSCSESKQAVLAAGSSLWKNALAKPTPRTARDQDPLPLLVSYYPFDYAVALYFPGILKSKHEDQLLRTNIVLESSTYIIIQTHPLSGDTHSSNIRQVLRAGSSAFAAPSGKKKQNKKPCRRTRRQSDGVATKLQPATKEELRPRCQIAAERETRCDGVATEFPPPPSPTSCRPFTFVAPGACLVRWSRTCI